MLNKENGGFTTVEIIIVSAILVIVSVGVGQLNVSLSTVFNRNQKELSLKNNINKLNLYLDEDIRKSIAVEEVDASRMKFKKPAVRIVNNGEVIQNTLPQGRYYSQEVEYKLELEDEDLVLKRNDKVVLSQLSQDIIDDDGVPQINKVLKLSGKIVDISLDLEDSFKNKNLDYQIKDRVYLQDTDAKGTIIFYKTRYPLDSTYLHYNLNEKGWTTDPGIKMMKSKYAGYTKLYIALEDRSNNTIKLDFTDNNGNWDNNDGDYIFNF